MPPTPQKRSLQEVRDRLLAEGVEWSPGVQQAVLAEMAQKGFEPEFDIPLTYGGSASQRGHDAFMGGMEGGLNNLGTLASALVNKVGLDDDHSMMRTSLERGERIAQDRFIPGRNFFDDIAGAFGSSVPMAGAGLATGVLTGNPMIGLGASVLSESLMEQGGSIEEIMSAQQPEQFDARADKVLGETLPVLLGNIAVNSLFAGAGGAIARGLGGKTMTSMLARGPKSEILMDTASEAAQEFSQSLIAQRQAHQSLGREVSYKDAAYEAAIAAPIGFAGGGVASAWQGLNKSLSDAARSELVEKAKRNVVGATETVVDAAKGAAEKAGPAVKRGRVAVGRGLNAAADAVEDFKAGREAAMNGETINAQELLDHLKEAGTVENEDGSTSFNPFVAINAAQRIDDVLEILRATKLWARATGHARRLTAAANQKINALREEARAAQAEESSGSPAATPESVGETTSTTDAPTASAILDQFGRPFETPSPSMPPGGGLDSSPLIEDEFNSLSTELNAEEQARRQQEC